MRTTVTIDDDVFEAAQIQARVSGKRLGEVLSKLARRGLRAGDKATVKNRLPVFNAAPNAKMIPSSRARKLLARD